MTHSQYPYTYKDLFQFPEKYGYSKCSEDQFFKDYLASRICHISDSSLNFDYSEFVFDIKNPTIQEMIDAKLPNIPAPISGYTIHHFIKGHFSGEFDQGSFDFVLKRFEITKKLFTLYRAPKGSTKVLDNPHAYLLYSATLVDTFQRNTNEHFKLICLNALLKLNDLIMSQKSWLSNFTESEKHLLKSCLANELSAIDHLKEQK